MNETDTIEWCAGLPFARQRPMEEAERQGLRREARKQIGLCLGSVTIFVITLAMLASLAFADPPGRFQQAYIMALAVMIALGFPCVALLARDCARRASETFRDLRDGSIKRFEGTLNAGAEEDATLGSLLAAKLLPQTQNAPLQLEILPASRRVWRVNEAVVRGWIIAQTVRVARTPEQSRIAAQRLASSAPRPTDAAPQVTQRDLSPAEQDELRRYARRLWLRPLPFAALMTLMSVWAVASVLLRHDPNFFFHSGRTFTLLSIAAGLDSHWLRNFLVARRLGQDMAQGQVSIANDPSNVMETLPVSQKTWTENGQPASWRVLKS